MQQAEIFNNTDLKDLVDELQGLLDTEGMVAEKDRGFAESLCKQFNNKGKLSDKQRYWVGILIERSISGDEVKPEAKVAPVVSLQGSFSKMIELFNKAKEHLKYPKVYLQTEAGDPVVLGVAGPNAKFPGSINVTDGGPYGANEWYGRIQADGNWEQPKYAEGNEAFPPIEALLNEFANDPQGTATKYGHLTGNCCFCMKKLTDEKSTAVGYGPTCAKNYGLPWGNKS